MKIYINLILVFALQATATNLKHWNESLRRLVPKKYNIESNQDAKAELMDHLTRCGQGVIKGQPQSLNKCHYQIELDDLFFEPIQQKTGYIHDPNWPYQNGIMWATASQKEMEEVPTKWDLSDKSRMIRITRQRCGDCWAQASRANLEQLILTYDNVNEPLSTQYLISSCCNTGSCSGGYMSTPAWIAENGMPILERDPYKGSNSSCKFNSNDVMDYHLMQAPNIGSSLNYSRAIRAEDRIGTKVKNIQAMMIKHRSSAVVTIQAISQSGGIIKSCSAINSGGNHMQALVGWYEHGGDNIARVQNSWGTDHGQDGYTHMKWECGDGRLNRGLARSARVGVYIVPVGCNALAEPKTGPNRQYIKGPNTQGVRIGKKATNGQSCEWFPKVGLSDPYSCHPIANPKLATEYHLIAKTDCGEGSAMVVVSPLDPKTRARSKKINTPHGTVPWNGI